jgi:hypothetical protein
MFRRRKLHLPAAVKGQVMASRILLAPEKGVRRCAVSRLSGTSRGNFSLLIRPVFIYIEADRINAEMGAAGLIYP